ncbi:alpha/beta hydrolase [Actinoallomurus bryophytorum]|uniref:Alpha/beta hydrolase family protein n=2 Tax=Actinoallomurus bryophytorum TaxID=1490222 RepID=A0A543CGU3_9ACTN|nr:alpha/beta hydrolase family protein [Actinoallomurus bryophytorum]
MSGLCAAFLPLTASVASVASPVPALHWISCDDGFQCATAQVPLDHRRPHGAMIDIAVMRHPATDTAHRIGSLFVNGGGPSEQLLPLRAEYGRIPAAWRARYDIVGFDPRGFGSSTAIRCFPTMDAESKFLSGLPAVPDTGPQIADWDRTWARFDARCASRGGALLRHDSTADVARDMDLLRQATGDPVMNYVGLSYGTGLGATYANLFPGRVGRMILDGNLDPVAWTHGDGRLPAFLRMGADKASAATLDALLDLCGKASTTACAFSAGTPAATHAKFETLLSRLRAHPVPIGTPPDTLSCDDLCAVFSLPLADVGAWKAGTDQLQQLWTASATGHPVTAPARSSLTAPQAPSSLAAPQAPYAGQEQTLAVLCSDSANPRDPRAYTAAARLASARSGLIGLSWVWPSEACAKWPTGRDGYTGPWNRRTAGPILLVGITGDPATSYANSVAMSRALARARLLTVHGYGHTELSNPSACAGDYEDRYLLTGALPPPGTVCEQDTIPFS